MCRITHSTNLNSLKILKKKFVNLIQKYNFIHNIFKVICNKNIKRPRYFGYIGSLGNMRTGRNLAKNCEIAQVFFSDIEKFRDIGLALSPSSRKFQSQPEKIFKKYQKYWLLLITGDSSILVGGKNSNCTFEHQKKQQKEISKTIKLSRS